MDLSKYYNDVPLTDLAEVKRVQKGVIYPVGTIYLRVSACSKAPNTQMWRMLEEDSELETSCAYLLPKGDWYSEYVVDALERCAPKFMERYVGKNINISMDLFDYYKLDYHYDLETQRFIASMLGDFNKEIKQTERAINEMGQFKEYHLRHLFC